jgi:hypothetical protein
VIAGLKKRASMVAGADCDKLHNLKIVWPCKINTIRQRQRDSRCSMEEDMMCFRRQDWRWRHPAIAYITDT